MKILINKSRLINGLTPKKRNVDYYDMVNNTNIVVSDNKDAYHVLLWRDNIVVYSHRVLKQPKYTIESIFELCKGMLENKII